MTGLPAPPSRAHGRPAAAAAPARLDGLAVLLPCLDEEDNISRAIAEAGAAARRVARRFEIIVVDDGSRDATAVIAAAVPGVRVVRHPANRGYGAAVRTGLTAARLPWVLITDGDRQFDLRRLEALVEVCGAADVVVGRRVHIQATWPRRAQRAIWNRLARRLLALPVRDPECSLKLLRRDVVDPRELTCDGPAIGAELLASALRGGARVTEVDVLQRARRAGGRPRRLSALVRALRELTALRDTRPRLPGTA